MGEGAGRPRPGSRAGSVPDPAWPTVPAPGGQEQEALCGQQDQAQVAGAGLTRDCSSPWQIPDGQRQPSGMGGATLRLSWVSALSLCHLWSYDQVWA